jgi:hypothetical protein
LIAAACVCWGIDNNLTRKFSSADPVQIAMLKGLVAGTVNLALAFALGASLPSIGVVVAVLSVGFLGYGVSLVFFVLALRHLGTARTGAYFSLAPFIGAILALALLHEPLSIRLVVAGGLMALGLWLHLTERHEHEHMHEDFEHEHRSRLSYCLLYRFLGGRTRKCSSCAPIRRCNCLGCPTWLSSPLARCPASAGAVSLVLRREKRANPKFTSGAQPCPNPMISLSLARVPAAMSPR